MTTGNKQIWRALRTATVGATLLLAVAGPALADPVAAPASARPVPPLRVAVLVGANAAAPGRAPLMFGHDDAAKMASVLTTVAGFRPQDVYLLRDPAAADLLLALQAAADRLEDRPESLLYFYYSGHADEQALYPAGQSLPLAKVRALIDGANISVRIGMVDACRGGGWTRAKGLRPDQPFPVHWPLGLETEGSVLIASSSGLESAHESDQLRGSFFTHHFAVALRGAADRNANGEVTITEAFEYAKERTIRDTLKVAREAQHPSYAVNLRGRRDLVLAQVTRATSNLELDQKQGPLELVHIDSGVSLLELPEGQRQVRLAVPPGIYLVRKKFPESILTKEVVVRAGQTTQVVEDELALVGSQQLVAKDAAAPRRPPVREVPDVPEVKSEAPGWVKLMAVTTLTISAAALVYSFKLADDIASVNRDLDPYRRYSCINSGSVTCDRSGSQMLRPITPDEARYVGDLQSEAKRFESYQYVSLGVFTAFALASIPTVIKWTQGGSPGAAASKEMALQLAPAWTDAGPGFTAALRF
jgi:hypothetical protein